MENLTVIDERELLGQQFKMYGTFEEPLFLAKDVAKWIEYDATSVHKMLALVDINEKVRNNVPTLGGNQEMWFLTEDGLYEVLMQSRKPIAKEFKREVKEILRSIRTHGGYLTPAKIEEVLFNPDTIIQLATNLKNEQEKNRKLTEQNQTLLPKADAFDEMLSKKGTAMMKDFAKAKQWGRNKLYKLLREKGIFMHGSVPYQRFINDGYFVVKYTEKYGITQPFTLITAKGARYIVKKMYEWKMVDELMEAGRTETDKRGTPTTRDCCQSKVGATI